MIIDLKVPEIHLPRLNSHASKEWQTWWIIIPRIAYVEGISRRVLLLPGRYETRVSYSLHCRVWREAKRGLK
jgi:hypothetical protein